MTDKHIPASKLLALPTYCKTSVNGYMDSELVIRSKIRALIDEAPEVEPVAYTMESELEVACYNSGVMWPAYCNIPEHATVKLFREPPPSPDLTKLVGELVEALENFDNRYAYEGCEKVRELLTRAKEYLK